MVLCYYFSPTSTKPHAFENYVKCIIIVLLLYFMLFFFIFTLLYAAFYEGLCQSFVPCEASYPVSCLLDKLARNQRASYVLFARTIQCGGIKCTIQ